MSTNIDERVVKMSFDDTGFEAGANKAIGILDNLKKALNFDSASDGIASAQKSINSLNMDSVSTSVEECSRHFGAFEAFVFGVFARLGQQATDLGENIVKRLTIQGAMEGFEEYQLQMGSIQTILSNTGDKLKANGLTEQSEQVGYINDKLDELNEYADKTIYNFSQMTRNIGLFTAAGVDLDTATSAIKGISNLAAASGADNAAAGRAMYNLSQAISTGTVKLMDWNSVVNAGMGGELFQNALKRTARAHGIAVDEIIAKQGSFRDSLSEGWLTADVLTDTLEQLTIEMGDVGYETREAGIETLKAKGYTAEEAEAILDLAKNAYEAATKVRTWKQLWDTVGESIGSGWATTWRIVVGDFLEATDLFTWFSERITGVINASNDARNEILQQWADAGGRVALVDTFKNIYQIIEGPLKAISVAFSNVFGITAEQLYNITTMIAKVTKGLILSDDAVEILTMVLTDVFTVIHSVLGVAGNLVRIFVSLASVVWEVIEPIGELGFLLFGFFADGVARLSEKIHAFSDVIEIQFFRLGHGFSTAIRDFVNGTISFEDMLDRFKSILGSVESWLLRSIPSVIGKIRGVVSNAISSVMEYLKSAFNGDEVALGFIDSFSQGFKGLKRFIKQAVIDLSAPFKSLISGKSSIFDFLESFKYMFDRLGGMIQGEAQRMFGAFSGLVGYIFGGLKNGVYSKLGELWEWAQSIGETILNAVKSFLGIESPSKEFFEVGKNVVLGLVNGVSEFLGKLKELGGNVGSVILMAISGVASGLKEYVSKNIIGIFEKLPEPIKNAIKSVKNFAESFVNQAKRIVTGSAFFHTLSYEFRKFKMGMSFDVLHVIKSLGETIRDVFGSIKTFVNGTPIGAALDSVTKSISKFASSIGVTLPSLEGIGNVFSDIFKSIKTSNAFTSLSETFDSIPSTLKSLFDRVVDSIFYGKDAVSKEAAKLSFDNVVTNIDSLVKSVSKYPPMIEEAAEWLKSSITGFLDSFGIDSIEDVSAILHDALGIGIGVTLMNFVKSLTSINKSIAGIVGWPKELGNALKSFGEGFTSWKKETKADAVFKIATAIAILAGALFLIASIPAEDLARAGKAMAIMTGAIFGILTVLSLLESKLSLLDTASMANVGGAVQSLGIGVLAFAAALFVLSKIPSDTMGDNILTLVEIATVLALLAKAISSDGKSIKSGAIGMIFMAAAVYAMAKAVEALGKLDASAVEKGMAPFVAIMIMLTIFGKFAAEGIGNLLSSILKFGAGLALIAVAFVIFGVAIKQISSILNTIDNLPAVLIVMGGALVAFAALCKYLEEVDTESVGKSLITFGASLLVIALALGVLAIVSNVAGDGLIKALVSFGALIAAFGLLAYQVDPKSLAFTAKSIMTFSQALIVMAIALGILTFVVSQGGDNFNAGLMAIMGLLIAFTAMSEVLSAQATNVQTVASSLLIFSTAILVMATAFLALGKVNIKEIIPQLIAIVAMFALFAVGAAALSGVAVAMVYVGASMLIFSAAVLVLAGAFWLLVQALQDLSAINPVSIITRLQAMGIGLAGMIVGFVKTLFFSIANAVTEHLPELLEAGRQILSGIMQGIQSLLGFVSENAGMIVGKIGEGITSALGALEENGGAILTTIIDVLKAGWDGLQENGGTIVEMIGNGIAAAKENILPKVTEFINGIKEKLGSEEFKAKVLETGKKVGKALLDGLGLVVDGIGTIVSSLFTKFTGCVGEKLGEVTAAAGEMATSFIEGIKNFFGINSPSTVMQEIGGFIVQGLINGLNVLGGLGDAARNLFNTVTDGVKNLPGNLLDLGKNALSNLSSAFSGGKSDIGSKIKGVVDGAAENAKGLGSKLKTAASTAMTTFGTAIKSGISGAKTHFSNLVSEASAAIAPMKNKLKSEASQAMTAFSNALKAGTGPAKSAVSRVMSSATSGIKSMYKQFYDVGANAVQGLVNGIDGRLGKARAKADELTRVVNKAAKAGFKERSPSRVFRGIGEYLVEGLIIGIDNLTGDAANASTNLSSTVIDSFGSSLNGMAVGMDDLLDTDYNPVITPVINSAEFDSNLQQLSALMNSRLANSIDVGNVNYNETFAGKLDAVADINKQAMQQFAESAIDYDLLGVSVANALIRSGVHVEMDGGQLMGYLAGEIRDVRRMSR